MFFVYIFPISKWLIFFLSSSLIILVIILASKIQQNKELSFHLKNIGKASEEVIEQINIRYNESLLIKEIGEGTSRLLELKDLLSFTTSALQKHLHFKRGIIMLSDPGKTELIYTAGYGLTPEQESIIKDTAFSLDKRESRGIFHLAYHHQKPFIIDHVDNVKNDLSEKSVHYINALGIKSFICVPIIYEGKSEGVLAVDNSESATPPPKAI